MAEGFRIATAFVQVSPDTEGFREELQAKLDESAAGTRTRVRVGLDTTDLDAGADRARARVDELGSRTARPTVRLEDGEAAAKIDAIRERLGTLSASNPSPRVRADISDAEAKVQAIEARIGRLNSVVARPAVTPQMMAAQAQIDRLTARLEELGQKKASPRVTADTAAAQARIDVLRARLNDLQAKDVQIRVKAGADLVRAEADLDRVAAKLSDAGRKDAKPKLSLNDSDFQSKLSSALSRLREFGAESAKVGAIAVGVGSLLPAVGGAAIGGGLLAGVGALGLGGISKAVSDAHQASLNVGITPQQQAATAFSNAVAVQQGQDQIGQARRQAAQDAITSANSIQQAQTNLASVERNAAQQQVQALQSVKQAEQGVEEANYSLSEAQYNLTQAWEAAREQVRQLDDQLADSKLNVQQAELAIQQAEYQQRLVNQNAYSTSLDRQQAALAVAQAQQRLTDAQDQQTSSAYAANLAHQQGVAGSQQVVQAQQAVTAAQYGQADAHAQLSDAQAQATLGQLNNADQLKAAQMQLAAASEQAAYQRQQDAHSIAVAERNLTDTIREQQLQLAATQSTENQAANQFARDMGRLTPAAQQVVQQILGMKGSFKQLTDTAQTAIAPGVTEFLRGLQSMLPSILPAVSQVGGLLSGMFSGLGKAMQSSGAKDVLQGLVDNGLQIAKTLGPALGGIAGALANIGSQKGAADGLSSLIGGLGAGLTNLVNGLSPFVGALSGLLQPLGQALAPLGGAIGTLVGHLAESLAPVLEKLIPPASKFISELAQGLAPILDSLGPLLQPVVEALSAIFSAFGPLLPVIGSLIGQLAKSLAPILQALVPIIQSVADMLAKELQKGLTEMLQALLPLFPPLAQLIVSLTPIIDVVVKLAGFILDLALKIQVPLTQAIVWIITKFADLASHWQGAVHDIEAGADWLWHHVFEPLWSGLSQGADQFVSDFGKAWSGLQDVFKLPVNFLIESVYTDGIEALWNGVVNAIGQKSIALPDIKKLATGGVLPGYAPGQDTIPAMLSPGEGVLVPEAVRALGPETVLALNAAYGGGRVSTPGHFSGGGISGFLGSVVNDISGAITKGTDVAKIIAAVTTGDTSGLNDALGKFIDTKGAAGNYAKLMLGIPTALVHDAVGAIGSMFGGGGGSNGKLPTGSSSAVGDLPANWQTIASFLAGHGFSQYAAAGVAGNIMAESGGDPEILEAGGGGGGGLIQWTPYPRSYITGDYQSDLMTQLNAILSWGGGPAQVNRATSPSSAAEIYQDLYERPASLTASLPQRMSSANAVAKGMNWAFDEGGLASGIGSLPKYTPRPERVLSPRQTQAFERLVAVLDRQSATDGSSAAGKQVVIHFHGTQHPTPEQMAAIKREMALALG
jgi:hypothetical protein